MAADITASGSWSSTENWLKKITSGTSRLFASLEKYGQEGVAALAAATPKDSGDTANSWYYEIVDKNGSWSIEWKNRNINDGVSIAILLQYGHATRNGGYVQGRDYINPALAPILDRAANEGWKLVIG